MENLESPMNPSPIPGKISSIQIIFNKHSINTSNRLIQHSSFTKPRRPQSALFSYQRPRMPSFLPLNSSKISKQNLFSRPVSPNFSRPSTSNNKAECNKQIFKVKIQETGSSFMTEHNAYIARFDSINAEYRTQNTSPVYNKQDSFSGNAQGFVHESFPVRKVVSRKRVKRNRNFGDKAEDVVASVDKCTRSSSNVFRNALKRLYHPVKYKLNYVPVRNKSFNSIREKLIELGNANKNN